MLAAISGAKNAQVELAWSHEKDYHAFAYLREGELCNVGQYKIYSGMGGTPANLIQTKFANQNEKSLGGVTKFTVRNKKKTANLNFYRYYLAYLCPDELVKS